MDLYSLLSEDVTVITASRRLAHALRLGYAQRAQQQGLTAWRTPRVLPWMAWLRQQYLDARATAPTPGLLLLTAAQTRVLWEAVVADSAFASDLLNPSSAARVAARSWRRLQDYLIPLERLSEFATAESQALHAWCADFARRCATLNAFDEAQLAHWAHRTSLLPTHRLAFVGFDALPPAMTRLVELWREQELIVDVPAQDSEVALTVRAAPDRDAEIEMAARWACERVRAGARSVGVIIGDLQARREAVSRAFEDAIAPGMRHTLVSAAALPVAIAAPAPLSSFPIVDAAMLVLQLAAEESSSTVVGRILRSAFLNGSQRESSLRALADLRLREEQRDRWNWFELERWAGVTGCSELQLRARALNAIVRGVTAGKPSDWAERFNAMWLAVGWPGDRTLSSVEHQALEKFRATLAQFGSLDVVSDPVSLWRATGMLRGLLTETPFEAESVGAAITVIDPTTSTGMRFDALWVAGLDAGSWPVASNPDPLIPLELQRAAGIPEASSAMALQHARAQLDRWQRSAASVVLSWPQREADIELARSELLSGLQTVETTVDAQQSAPLRRLMFDARPTLQLIPDERAPVLPPQAARGGARTIELQARCAFRAQAELRMKARPLPRVTLGIEPVDRGALLHGVLAEIWGELQTQQRLLSTPDAILESRVRSSAQRLASQMLRGESPHDARLVTLEIASIVRQIMRLLVHDRSRPSFTVHLAEAASQYAIGGLSITLRPDRIDVLEQGGELLVDYKLGDSHRPRGWLDALPGRPRQPQLPLYALARGEQLRALAYVVLAPGAVEYRGWSDGTNVAPGVLPYPGGVRVDLGDPADWEALLHHWRFTLTRLAEHYVAGDARVDPLPQECATCHLSTLCRIHELQGMQSALEAAGDE